MPRASFLTALLLTLVVATSYFYAAYAAVCPLPLSYTVGEVDARFAITSDTALVAVADAVAVWEDSLEQDIFTYTTDAELAEVTIDYIFDERQERTTAEARERERLAVVEALSGEVQAAYQRQVADLEAREVAYETRAATYERDLSRYNATVAEYNAEGGAPPEVFAELEAEAARLSAEADALNAEVAAINNLIEEINQLGSEGNQLISTFNERVSDFNSTFADGREFTQGDYRDGQISIYSFSDRDELHVVLVHELGHALGIGHVDDPTAYMHYLLGAQNASGVLRPDDAEAFAAVCTTAARLATVPQPWRTVFAWLGV
jgi:hypothetical protein